MNQRSTLGANPHGRSSVQRIARGVLCAIALTMAFSLLGAPANFSEGESAAVKFGVHEIALTGDAPRGNPFDTIVSIRFVPPSGDAHAKTVLGFYDGGTTWRARVYVSETGTWRWTSTCETDARLDGKSGAFAASESRLRGRLLVHPKNPWQWATEDGRWFLNLNDTAYFLLCPHQAFGQPVRDDDAKAYVRDLVARGITSLRSFTLVGPGGHMEDGPKFAQRWRDSVFEDDAMTRLRLPHFRVADERLRWLLNEFPDVYVQFILFPRGSRWSKDDQMWRSFTPEQRERVMRTMIARYAAYPQLFWLVTNDAHYGPEFPNNNAFAREVGEYFLRHDPWRHPMAAGHARRLPYYFGGEAWSTYLHLEENFDTGAVQCREHYRFGKPVFLGEDRYEQDHRDRDPMHMQYFQRRLFWSWLLSGGSANYGGRWWDVVPYGETGTRPSIRGAAGGEAGKTPPTVHSRALVGLDSVRAIRDYFLERKIELSDFQPAPEIVKNATGTPESRKAKVMRRESAEFLIYDANATSDDRTMNTDGARRVTITVDLTELPGHYTVEWYRALDGAAQTAPDVAGGAPRTLTSPWQGHDCVVRLRRK